MVGVRETIRYCIQIRQGQQVVKVVIIRLEVPARAKANEIKDMLNRKVFDYIKNEYPGRTDMGALVQGRVDAEF
jgi:hypothetical protein